MSAIKTGCHKNVADSAHLYIFIVLTGSGEKRRGRDWGEEGRRKGEATRRNDQNGDY